MRDIDRLLLAEIEELLPERLFDVRVDCEQVSARMNFLCKHSGTRL